MNWTKLFFDLTKKNWGWPYHWLIFYGFTQLFMFIGLLIFKPGIWENFLRLSLLVLLLNIVAWALVEIFQKVKDEKKYLIQDIIGNLLGFITGWLFTYMMWSIL